ncbi:MAG TPA: hypothetical protein VGH92_08985 [Gaiellaceae bacterium]|jgi:hypothetical protein
MKRTRLFKGLGVAFVAAAGLAASVAVGSAATGGAAATTTTTTTVAAPTNTSQPTISGKAQDGQLLTANNGTWTGSPTSYAYAWQRCDSSGGGCSGIAGANSKQYTATAGDVGHTLRVTVTATNAGGSGSAASKPTGVVASSGSAPANTKLPSINGTPQQGSALTIDKGDWSGTAPITYDYTWQRCDKDGNNCVTFITHSSTATTYTLGSADVGHTMRVEVTGTNSHGTGYVYSKPTAVVAPPKSTQSASVIAVNDVSLPNRLVIDSVKFSPDPVTSRNTPITGRFHVSDSHGLSVQGALVFALGLPYGWTYNAAEQATDASGWVTLTIRPTRNMPLRRGDLVMFIRARKPGDSLLAGVSTRRLVQDGIR